MRLGAVITVTPPEERTTFSDLLANYAGPGCFIFAFFGCSLRHKPSFMEKSSLVKRNKNGKQKADGIDWRDG